LEIIKNQLKEKTQKINTLIFQLPCNEIPDINEEEDQRSEFDLDISDTSQNSDETTQKCQETARVNINPQY